MEAASLDSIFGQLTRVSELQASVAAGYIGVAALCLINGLVRKLSNSESQSQTPSSWIEVMPSAFKT